MRKRTQLELDGIENGSIRLRTKPTARLSYAFVPQAGGNEGRRPDRLIIFLGGLDNPINIWQGTLSRLAELSVANGFGLPPILAYDRFGIGQSDPDPSDVGKPLEEYHDGMDAVRDLRQLLIQIAEQKLGREESELDELRIVFCAYSFGVCVARLYAQTFPGSLEALLMIDSAIANQLAETFTPNPDIPEVWERARHSLPPGTTPQMCRHINQKIMSSPYSGYALTSRERMRWTNMPDLLPFNDRPRLQGPDQGLPLVTVLCSDPQVLIPMTAKVRPSFDRYC